MGLHKSTKSSKLWSELGKWVFKTAVTCEIWVYNYEKLTFKLASEKTLSFSDAKTVKGRAMNMYEQAVKQVRDIYNRFLWIRTNCWDGYFGFSITCCLDGTNFCISETESGFFCVFNYLFLTLTLLKARSQAVE